MRVLLPLLLVLLLGCASAGGVRTLGDAVGEQIVGEDMTYVERLDSEGVVVERVTTCRTKCVKQSVDSRNPRRDFAAWLAAGASILAAILQLAL